ncbi:MAG: hypothetical protein AB202_02115 [Parcubacteria bacterium C7867-007]|nr:MAG: hypothetical protein AB202_02115 [Parcubacteria bacterium C7867-007]
MNPLPEAELYEESLGYWPYRLSLELVTAKVLERTPLNGSVLDIMCGPGYLLGKLQEGRSDLWLTGMDLDKRYVRFGRDRYLGVEFFVGDVLNWQPRRLFDTVVCTGSLHHVPYAQQEAAIANIASMVKPGGVVVISDCYVEDFNTETERRLAASRLGYEYLLEAIRNGATDQVIKWTIDILYNDVLKEEFKTSLKQRLEPLQRHFGSVITIQPWPDHDSGYGDYIHICTPK